MVIKNDYETSIFAIDKFLVLPVDKWDHHKLYFIIHNIIILDNVRTENNDQQI